MKNLEMSGTLINWKILVIVAGGLLGSWFGGKWFADKMELKGAMAMIEMCAAQPIPIAIQAGNYKIMCVGMGG